MPSVTCLRLSDVSVICRVIYLQFPIQACFSSVSVSQAAQWRKQTRKNANTNKSSASAEISDRVELHSAWRRIP